MSFGSARRFSPGRSICRRVVLKKKKHIENAADRENLIILKCSHEQHRCDTAALAARGDITRLNRVIVRLKDTVSFTSSGG